MSIREIILVKCDRCSRTTDDKDFLDHGWVVWPRNVALHLCDDCNDSLVHWFQNPGEDDSE